jgi:Holliday junction resolvase
MVNPRQKGATCETDLRDKLRKATGLLFERVPGSGAGKIKGDLYLPTHPYIHCIEVKHYADSHWNDKIFTSKTNNFVVWWKKIVSQAKETNKEPLLIFKYNRSKYFIATVNRPTNTENFVDIRWLKCYTLLLDEWLFLPPLFYPVYQSIQEWIYFLLQ